MTQAVLAKVVFGTPVGCAGCFISLEKVNKDLTFKSYGCKICVGGVFTEKRNHDCFDITFEMERTIFFKIKSYNCKKKEML